MLLNKTKNKVVIERVKFADSFFKRFRGLIFSRAKKFNYALIFDMLVESRISCSVHMLFVFFPIDIIFLDKNKRVVDIARRVKPFTISYIPKKPARYFIEMPVGKSANVATGDILNWQ